MSLWFEMALVFGGLVALIVVVWVPILVMGYRRSRSGRGTWGILRLQATVGIVGLALAAIAFIAVVLSPH